MYVQIDDEASAPDQRHADDGAHGNRVQRSQAAACVCVRCAVIDAQGSARSEALDQGGAEIVEIDIMRQVRCRAIGPVAQHGGPALLIVDLGIDDTRCAQLLAKPTRRRCDHLRGIGEAAHLIAEVEQKGAAPFLALRAVTSAVTASAPLGRPSPSSRRVTELLAQMMVPSGRT
jgi:hypothetical protein